MATILEVEVGAHLVVEGVEEQVTKDLAMPVGKEDTSGEILGVPDPQLMPQIRKTEEGRGCFSRRFPAPGQN